MERIENQHPRARFRKGRSIHKDQFLVMAVRHASQMEPQQGCRVHYTPDTKRRQTKPTLAVRGKGAVVGHFEPARNVLDNGMSSLSFIRTGWIPPGG
jgi:hypothetical protein